MNVHAPVFDDVLRELRDERARLREAHENGLGGLDHARALAGAMDRAVVSIWNGVTEAASGLALVAIGGYGRGELSPHSDIDLMVLHAGSKDAREASERLFYPLWDAGFTVGHATRTVKESLRLAKENLEAETSLLHARLLAGDESLYDELVTAALRVTRKRQDRFVRDVREMMRARHLVGGSATSQLEPNLKEGAGGLRDLHVLDWFERVVGDGDGLEALGLIGARDRAHVDAAAELLHRVRTHLHYLTDRPTDVLLFQHQEQIARFLGYDARDRRADDAFMRDLFAATRAVEHVVSAVVAELSAPASSQRSLGAAPFAVEGGRVIIVREPDVEAESHHLIDVFAQGSLPGSVAMRWVDAALERLPDEPRWTEAVRASFLALLRTGDPHALEAADHAGVIGRFLPEWDAVRCQPQHNVYHRFTVDAHLFNTAAQVYALERQTDDPLVREVWSRVKDRDALALAALLHDVGKGTDEDHAVRGERVAVQLMDRMGITGARRDTIAWLVRHHLLLVEAATRRDLNDENLVVDVATRIGDAERARMLFLLSVADGLATGPSAWSPWKASLVGELFIKVIHVLERGELVTRDALELVRLRTSELRGALTRYPPDAVEAHLAGVSRAYLMAFPTTVLIRHFALMADPLEAGDVRANVVPGDEPGVYEYSLVARDRPGLFAKASGVLALDGVNIVTAQGFTRADGLAVEVFRCVGAFESTIEQSHWDRITDNIGRALKGRLSLDVRLAEKRKAYERGVARGKREAPKVIVDNAASDFLTVVEVHAADRVGLLYDITSAFADMAMDIQVAKIATYAEDVVDVFYVRDLDGQKITDPEHLREIERALLLRLHSA